MKAVPLVASLDCVLNLMFQRLIIKLFTVWYVGNPVDSLCAQ